VEQPGDFFWVRRQEPVAGELATVAEVFALHPLAVEDALHAHQRPKLERYDDGIFLVLKTLWYVDEDDAVETGEINLFVGRDFVISVRHGEGTELHTARLDLEQQTAVLGHGPSAVVYAICDRVVDSYEAVSRALETDVAEVEQSVFSPTRTHDSRRIYVLKRELAEVRRAVNPLREPMKRFSTGSVPAVSQDAAPFFRDVNDHLTRVSETIETLDTLLSTAFDAHLGHVPEQFLLGLLDGLVIAVAVGAFAQDHIGLLKGHGLGQQTVHITPHITGEGQSQHSVAVVQAQVHGRAAQDVAGIRERELDPGCDLRGLGVSGRVEKFKCGWHILLGVQRFLELHFTTALAGTPYIVGMVVFLDVRTVREHDGAELARGRRAPDRSRKALGHQAGQQAAMVDVRMAEHHDVDRGGLETELSIGVLLRIAHRLALEHAAIQQQSSGGPVPAGQFEQVFGTGDRSCGSVAGQGDGHVTKLHHNGEAAAIKAQGSGPTFVHHGSLLSPRHPSPADLGHRHCGRVCALEGIARPEGRGQFTSRVPRR
jgi:magnesium transporter